MENITNNQNHKEDNSLSKYATSFDFESSLKLSNEFKVKASELIDITDIKKANDIKTDDIKAKNENNAPGASVPNQLKSSKPQQLSESIDRLNLYLTDLENLVTSKLNTFSERKRKALGYSMIAVGIILSLLLIVSTVKKLDFSDVLVSPGSKEALTGLASKASKATSQISDLALFNNQINGQINSQIPNNENNNQISVSDDEINQMLNNWQPITSLLASTDKRRKAVAKELGVHQGEWILATFSVDCGDCDRAASKLNQLKLNGKVSNVLAITTANQTDASIWKERLGLSFEVRSVSFDTFDDTGAVFLPTIIKLKNGVSIGAKENLEGK